MSTSTVSVQHDHSAADATRCAFCHYPYIVQRVLDGARYDMRRLATLGEYEEISYGQVLAMMWLGHISFTEFMAFSNERIFLVRRARERSIGV